MKSQLYLITSVQRRVTTSWASKALYSCWAIYRIFLIQWRFLKKKSLKDTVPNALISANTFQIYKFFFLSTNIKLQIKFVNKQNQTRKSSLAITYFYSFNNEMNITKLWRQKPKGDKVIRYIKRGIFKQIIYVCMPIPVAERSEVWVCSRSPAGIAGSNSAGGTYVCLLWVLCIVR